jgi:predicted N-acetyltransferase YhbS
MTLVIETETAADVRAREALLDRAMGAGRFAKTSERLREGRLPAEGLALVAREGDRLVGTVRLWSILAGPGCPALLLGPLAVDPDAQGGGIGGALMRAALNGAGVRGHGAVLLVGDPGYYARFGFDTGLTDRLWLPGPYERHRFQGLELQPGALDGVRGMVSATGAPDPAAEDLRAPIWSRLKAELRAAA